MNKVNSNAVNTDQTTPQTIGLTGSRLTALWATDVSSTNGVRVGTTPVLFKDVS